MAISCEVNTNGGKVTGKERLQSERTNGRRMSDLIGGFLDPLEHCALVTVRDDCTMICTKVPEGTVKSLGSHEMRLESNYTGEETGSFFNVFRSKYTKHSIPSGSEQKRWLRKNYKG